MSRRLFGYILFRRCIYERSDHLGGTYIIFLNSTRIISQTHKAIVKMLFRLITALGLVCSTSAIPSYTLRTRQANTLNAAIVAKGRSYIGTSLTIRNDNTEQNLIKGAEFGSITPENAMKWDAIEPNRGQFSWGGADQIANFATQNNKQMRCHTLVWYSQLPNWGRRANCMLVLLELY